MYRRNKIVYFKGAGNNPAPFLARFTIIFIIVIIKLIKVKWRDIWILIHCF